jgi:hypothetical protein
MIHFCHIEKRRRVATVCGGDSRDVGYQRRVEITTYREKVDVVLRTVLT